jgi:flagellar biosynthesis/type III secretory pathway protein FliH
MLRAATTAVCALALAFGFGVPARADHDSHAAPLEAHDQGYQRGYTAGFHKGLDDRDHHHNFKPDVKDTDDGYQKYMGSKDQYKDGYRSGFLAGYEDAFNNRPDRFRAATSPYDRDRYSADRSVESHIASEIGYRDGMTAGEDDYARHHDARPEDRDDYRHADHGYRSDYGDKSLYQQQYREAFMQGYRDGYQGRR